LDYRKLIQKKLRETRYFLNLIGTASRRRSGDPEEIGFLLSAFLSASRPITDLLDNRQHRAWLETWKKGRTAKEQDLLEFMRKQRNVEVHLEGADTATSIQFVPIWEMNRGRTDHPAYHVSWCVMPGMEPPKIAVTERQFELSGTKVEVVIVCAELVKLLSDLVADFEAAHP
jgi:hypothetical protein